MDFDSRSVRCKCTNPDHTLRISIELSLDEARTLMAVLWDARKGKDEHRTFITQLEDGLNTEMGESGSVEDKDEEEEEDDDDDYVPRRGFKKKRPR